MKIVVFASGGGGNLKAAIDLSLKNPSLLKVGLVITDRLEIPAIKIAQKYNIPVIAQEFEKECGVWDECKNDPRKVNKYKKCATSFHNRTLQKITKIKRESGQPFDLAVLSYHRWIHGDLLNYFEERMINQHAGDSTVTSQDNPQKRLYVGINPVLMSLKAGDKKTRTTTFIVREGHDSGEILCQGPWVTYTGPQKVTKESAWKHELIQKKESDWPSLKFALTGIALGKFGLAKYRRHPDGCKAVTYEGRPLPYCGIDLSKRRHSYADRS